MSRAMLWLAGVLLCTAATATPHEVIIAGTGHGTFHAFTSAPQSSLALNPALNVTQNRLNISTTEWVLAHPTLPVLYVVDNRGPSMPGRIFAYRIRSTRESDDIQLQQIRCPTGSARVLLATARACWLCSCLLPVLVTRLSYVIINIARRYVYTVLIMSCQRTHNPLSVRLFLATTLLVLGNC